MADSCMKCGCLDRVKNGIVKDKQRWKCLGCGYNYRVDVKRGYPEELRQLALQLYLEGVGFRGIGRVLKVSNVAVLNWVKDAAKQLIAAKNTSPQHVHMMEIDEMCSYVSKKTAASGCGWLLIEKPRKSLVFASVIVDQKH